MAKGKKPHARPEKKAKAKAKARAKAKVARGRLRDDFPIGVLRSLSDDVGGACSLCSRPTRGPSAQPNRRSNVGTGAHITAASPGGPRYDDKLTPQQRRSAENGIWCCRDCGKLVDDDIVTFSVEMLREAKARAIAKAHRAVLTGDPDPDGYRRQAQASRHQAAKDVVAGLHALRPAIAEACIQWENWRANRTGDFERLYNAIKVLEAAIARFARARDEARALWGEYVVAPLQTYGDECSILLNEIVMDLKNAVPKEISDRHFEEARAGGPNQKQMQEYAALIERWAAPFLGREGAVELTDDELAAIPWRIRGFPEDQVQRIVEDGRFVREQERTGRSRAEIKAMLDARNLERSASRALSAAPLATDQVSGEQILAEIEKVVERLAAAGETELNVRLASPYDEALEAALMSKPGGDAVLGERLHALAKRFPGIRGIQVAAGGLPTPGWRFPPRG